jgi:DnaJ family protein C protein 2
MTPELKELWLRMQRGHETLIDPKRRRTYDSTLPFDDDLPTTDMWKTDKQFYSVMLEVFERNAFWSPIKNCPMPGDAETPMKEVRNFYKFWNDFKSWRVFSQFHEHKNIEEEANDRYERRHMENENKKKEKKYLNLEKKRILDLVDFCYQNDPRIIAENKAAEDAKAEIANAKRERFLKEKKEKEEALAKIKAAEEEKKNAGKDAAEAEKKAKADLIRALKSAFKVLKELLESKLAGSTKYDKFWVEGTCQKTFRKTENIQSMIDKL